MVQVQALVNFLELKVLHKNFYLTSSNLTILVCIWTVLCSKVIMGQNLNHLILIILGWTVLKQLPIFSYATG